MRGVRGVHIKDDGRVLFPSSISAGVRVHR